MVSLPFSLILAFFAQEAVVLQPGVRLEITLAPEPDPSLPDLAVFSCETRAVVRNGWLELRVWTERELDVSIARPRDLVPQRYPSSSGLARLPLETVRGERVQLFVLGPTGARFDLTWHEGQEPPLLPQDFATHELRRAVALAGAAREASGRREAWIPYAEALGELHAAEDADGLIELAPAFVDAAVVGTSASMATYGRVLLTWALFTRERYAEAADLADLTRAEAVRAGFHLDAAMGAELERSAALAHLRMGDATAAAAAARRLQDLPDLDTLVSPELAPRLWADLGEHHWRRYEAAAARDCFRAALEAAGPDCPDAVRFRLQRHLALCSHEIGDHATAKELLHGLETRADLLAPAEAVLVQIQLADVERELGQDEDALLRFAQAERMAEIEGLEALAAKARLYRADLLSLLDRSAEAYPLFRSIAGGADVHPLYRARAAAGLGFEALEQGDWTRALEIAEGVLADLGAQAPAEWRLHGYLLRIAAHLEARQLDEATRAFAEAEQILATPALTERSAEVAYFLSRYQGLSALAMDFAALQVADAPAGARAERVLDAWSRANAWKGRSVLESIVDHQASASAPALSLDDLRERLADGWVLLDFVAGRERLYAFRYFKGGVSLHDLGAQDEIAHHARRLGLGLAQASAQSEWWTHSSRLHHLLIAPLLPEGATGLVIVPTGELARVPFEALTALPPGATEGDLAQARFLFEDVLVTYAPSVPVLLRLRGPAARNGGQVLVVADPTFTGERLPALPGTRAEADAIQASAPDALRFTGEDCRKEAVLEHVAAARWLHFGTHAWQDRYFPARSTLALAGDGSEDVSLQEIAALDLQAEVAVLSACDTAVGRNLPGDGLQSIASAFLMAGSQGVIGSLWPVQDDQAAALMSDFYGQALGKERAPAEALREAKRAFLARARAAAGGMASTAAAGTLRGGRGLDRGASGTASLLHPYFWAAFTYSGALPTAEPRAIQQPATRVLILKFLPGLGIPYRSDAQEFLPNGMRGAWMALQARFPGIALQPTYPEPIRVETFSGWIKERGFAPNDPVLMAHFEHMRCFYEIRLQPNWNVEELRAELRLAFGQDLEACYPRTGGSSPRGAGGNGTGASASSADDHFGKQNYLQSPDWLAPPGDDYWLEGHRGGIGVADLWTPPDGSAAVPGSDAAGVTILDLERNWFDGHGDLPTSKITHHFGKRDEVLAELQHGVAVLGILCGTNDGSGITGIAHGADAIGLATYLKPDGAGGLEEDIDDAIVMAADLLPKGGILLLEVQTDGLETEELNHRPVEIFPELFAAIRLCTLLGIVVVEPAGNHADEISLDDEVFFETLADAGIDVSTYADTSTSAIVVGGSFHDYSDLAGAVPYDRSLCSFGSLLSAFAFGREVATCWTNADASGGWSSDHTSNAFTGTSAASAIIAGAVAVLQGIALEKLGRPLTPEEMLELIRDVGNTASGGNDTHWIGLMPNLPYLVEKHPLFASASDLYVRDETADDGGGLSASLLTSPDIVLWGGSVAPISVDELLASGFSGVTSFGSSTSAYVVAHNRGTGTSSSGRVDLYWAKTSSFLQPSDFSLVGSSPLDDLAPGASTFSKEIVASSGVPSTLEGCLMAVVSATDDEPADFSHVVLDSPDRFASFVRHHNNYALRSVVVKPYKVISGTKTKLAFDAGGSGRPAKMDLEFQCDLPAGASLDWILTESTRRLLQSSRGAGRDGLETLRSIPLSTTDRQTFTQLHFAAGAKHPIELEVSVPASGRAARHRIVALQRWQGRVVGRVEFLFLPERDPEAPGRPPSLGRRPLPPR